MELLTNADLTRIEGFVREAHLPALVDLLAVDVVGPLVESIAGQPRVRAEGVLDRWAADPDVWLRRASLLAPLRALKSGGGEWDAFARRARMVAGLSPAQDNSPDQEAIATVLEAVGERRPELRLIFRRQASGPL